MIKKDKEVYVTWLPREKCEEYGNQHQKFELGMSHFIQCIICETQFFDIDESREHGKNIHPIGVADETHKPYSTSTMRSWTLRTYTCSVCGYESDISNHRCGNCNIKFKKHRDEKP